MKKVAVLYICTGQYVCLWKEFIASAEKNLLKQCEVHYFVFTDAPHLDGEDENRRIHRIYQQPQPWPYATLKRFDTFLQIEDQLQAFDYIYFFNANAEFKAPITEEMFLPRPEKGEHLVFVLHPAFYWRPNYEFTYDRNPRSKAYIPMGLGKDYVTGAVNGGEAKAYLKLCRLLDKRTRQDLEKGIIALWHDESHLNWYAFKHPKYRLLDASFCYFEGWKTKKPCYILLRAKERYFDVGTFKKDPPATQLSPRVEAYNHFMMRVSRYLQRRMPWLPRRPRE